MGECRYGPCRDLDNGPPIDAVLQARKRRKDRRGQVDSALRGQLRTAQGIPPHLSEWLVSDLEREVSWAREVLARGAKAFDQGEREAVNAALDRLDDVHRAAVAARGANHTTLAAT